MPRRRVVGVTGDVGLVVVWRAEGQLASSHHTPVRARAAVAGQAREVRSGVGVLPEGLKADGVIPEARVPALDLRLVDRDRSGNRLALGMVSSFGRVRLTPLRRDNRRNTVTPAITSAPGELHTEFVKAVERVWALSAFPSQSCFWGAAFVTVIVTKTLRNEPDIGRRVETARCRRLRPA